MVTCFTAASSTALATVQYCNLNKPNKAHLISKILTNSNSLHSKCVTAVVNHPSYVIPRLVSSNFHKTNLVRCCTSPTTSTSTTHYEFSDGSIEVELRLALGDGDLSSKEVSVDANENSLVVKLSRFGSVQTLIDTNSLYHKIKPGETIWYIDDDQLVINLKKQDPELKWPDIVESWESLSSGLVQLLKGTSIFLVGESTEINEKIARELAVGLGYTPLSTRELLEAVAKQTIESWVAAEGSESVAVAESAILESLSSHARAVVATLGDGHGAAAKRNNWRHLFAGFTFWLSESNAPDESSAKEEVRKHIKDAVRGYTNSEVVVKLGGWDVTYSKSVAQASLSALKQLIMSDKQLPGKKSLYIRLGCRGDWPDIKPPGWNPSVGTDASRSTV